MDFVNYGPDGEDSTDELEKEYTALKTKENEDQIELRRLRTENRLLRQRIENLEKVEARLLRQSEESATLADRLVQDQVTRAHEAEEVYSLRNQLSVTRAQLEETRRSLMDAQDIIGDIKKRTRIIEDAVHLDENEERNMVKYLQEELIAVRLRETETASTIKELHLKIADLEDTNLRLQRAPSNDVQQLQEELIAVKLREAEANLSLKELRMKVNEIESYWESHMERVRQASPKEKGTKAEVRHLQEEVMSVKTKEARAVAEVKEVRQKLMELETQNHICTNQIRRMGDDNKELKRQLDESAEREKDLRTNIKDLTRKLDDMESTRKEEVMMARIKEAESIQQMAELRHKIAEIDIQKEEMLAAGRLHSKEENQELENRLQDLQDEMLQLQMHKVSKNRQSLMSDSYLGNNSDEELDADLQDSANLNRTLSDIIEGKSPNTSHLNVFKTTEDMPLSLNTLSAAPSELKSSENAKSDNDAASGDNLNTSHSFGEEEAGDDCGNSDRDQTVANSSQSQAATKPQSGANSLSEGVAETVVEDATTSVPPNNSDSAQGKTKSRNAPVSSESGAKASQRLMTNSKQPVTSFTRGVSLPEDTSATKKVAPGGARSIRASSLPFDQWEMYEEVVTLNKDGKEVVERVGGPKNRRTNSATTGSGRGKTKVTVVVGKDLKNLTGGFLGHEVGTGPDGPSSSSSKRHCLLPKSSQGKDLGSKGTSDRRNSFESVKHAGEESSNGHSGGNGKNNPGLWQDRRKIADRDSRCQGGKKHSRGMDEIPDVEVIYEPSCMSRPFTSCLESCLDDLDCTSSRVLKESSV